MNVARGPKGRRKSMADFIQSSETKSAIRELASQIEDVTTFNSIVQSVITDNPFACVSYMTAGVTHDPVEKTKESYTVKLVYHNSHSEAHSPIKKA